MPRRSGPAGSVGYNAAELDGHFPAGFALVRAKAASAEVQRHVMNPVFRFATVQGQNFHWFLRRNCSVTPRQLGFIYLSMCVVSLGLGGMFWLQGATLVLPIAWLELMVVGAAFLIYARHAADGETIRLSDGQLVIEQESAGKLSRCEFRREWVRVEPGVADNSLIALSGHGRTVHVGRFVRPELRPLLAREIRMALRGA